MPTRPLGNASHANALPIIKIIILCFCNSSVLQYYLFIITARKRSLGQGNIVISVCQEFCPQGGLPQCMLGYHPPGPVTPPGADLPSRPPPSSHLQEQSPPPPPSRHPPGSRHPPAQCMLGYTVNKRAVRILLECNLVFISDQHHSSMYYSSKSISLEDVFLASLHLCAC